MSPRFIPRATYTLREVIDDIPLFLFGVEVEDLMEEEVEETVEEEEEIEEEETDEETDEEEIMEASNESDASSEDVSMPAFEVASSDSEEEFFRFAESMGWTEGPPETSQCPADARPSARRRLFAEDDSSSSSE